MLPQIVIVLFVLICILIIKIKEFIESNSDIILIVLCAITFKKAAIGKAGQPAYVPPWKRLFRHAGILLGIHLCRRGRFSGMKKAGKLRAVTYRLCCLGGGEGGI